VKVFDAGGDGDKAYLVMELVPGEPLAKLLESKTLDRPRLLRLLEKVARGIQHAHEKGVIHRDLKPDNILVSGEEPKVADFGLAHLVESSPALTRSGAVLGTPMYMAPEQVEGGQEITARTDVHALGMILYEILAGQTPYSGATLPEVYAKIAHDEPRPPRAIDPSIPWELDAIALKAIEKDPGRRYATAADFADDLRRYLAGEPVLARPVSRMSRIWRRAVKQRAVVLPSSSRWRSPRAGRSACAWPESAPRRRPRRSGILESGRPSAREGAGRAVHERGGAEAMLAAVDVAERAA
jgi:serine/threonine protein kinase